MNYEKDLVKNLESKGYVVGFWINIFRDDNECQIERAKQILVSNFEEGIVAKLVYVPKIKEVTVEWVIGKVTQESDYKSLANYCRKLVTGKGLVMYPASYGIGFFILFGEKTIHESAKLLEVVLDKAGIEYKTEFSDARWVYRFKISKSKENIEKLRLLL